MGTVAGSGQGNDDSRISAFRSISGNVVRLGIGEVTTPKVATWVARNAFLIALNERAPHVLTDLFLHVGEEWFAFLEIIPNTSPDNELTLRALKDSAELNTYIDALFNYAGRYGLACPWFVRVLGYQMSEVLDRIDRGQTFDHVTADGMYVVHLPSGLPDSIILQVLADHLPSLKPAPLRLPDMDDMDLDFHPAIERAAEHEERAIAVFRQKLRASQQSRIAEVSEQFPQKVGRPKKYEHFDWLVRYQVLEESRQYIAGKVGKDRASVGREINATADLIGLELRLERGQKAA